ncbi:D-aminoacyl-tRNA deacylase [Pseudokineococcus sp. 1T1Z-3]|uniref:D-aminoacyl-tRNA deacylase n=1 Tax=Pseudokineococcus sp. 1T1Z-3 TaxID=3132745 RepID=UPI0030996153
MRTVLQRVSAAAVRVDGEVVGALDLDGGAQGLVLLVGVARDDGPEQVATLVRKAAELRVLAGDRSALDAGAPVLVVSQFTLQGDVRKGRRPSWSAAAPGEVAEPLVRAVAEGLRARGLPVATGRFGADMAVEMVGDGPLTLILDT